MINCTGFTGTVNLDNGTMAGYIKNNNALCFQFIMSAKANTVTITGTDLNGKPLAWFDSDSGSGTAAIPIGSTSVNVQAVMTGTFTYQLSGMVQSSTPHIGVSSLHEHEHERKAG
jgi:hypothetical protein